MNSHELIERLRSIGHKLHASLALLFLQLQADATNRSLLNALHQVGGEACDLVTQPLGGDGGHLLRDLLVDPQVFRAQRLHLL